VTFATTPSVTIVLDLRFKVYLEFYNNNNESYGSVKFYILML
jgi:hypothetical protein